MINEMEDQFRVRYFYTSKGEDLSQNVEKEYEEQSPVESVVLWYIARYKWEDLQSFIKSPDISITHEPDWIKIKLKNEESEHDAKLKFAAVTDKVQDYAQDYSYIHISETLRNTILFVVQSDPPDNLKSGNVVLVSNKKLCLVGHKDELEFTRKTLIQRVEDQQIDEETLYLVPQHLKFMEELCIIEILQQKHQVQIGLKKSGDKGNLNITGAKENVQKCVAGYWGIISAIKSEIKNIPESWVNLLKNKAVQDYIREELRRTNIKCVWKFDEHNCRVEVYSLDSDASREVCKIICGSMTQGTYPTEICTQQDVQILLNRNAWLLKISEQDDSLTIVGVRKIIDSINDMLKPEEKLRGKNKQGETQNTDVVIQYDCNDGDKQTADMKPNAATPLKRRQSSVDENPSTASMVHSHNIQWSSFDVLQNLKVRAMVERRLQEAQLKCQWQVKTQGYDYYLEILSDKHITIRDLILQIVDTSKPKVREPGGEFTEVRLHIDNDRLTYMQEYQRELLKNIAESYCVEVNLEDNDEFVIRGERKSALEAKKQYMTICKGIRCSKTEVDEGIDLGRPEVTTKLRDLERKERCIIEFPGVHQHRPRCLYSLVYLHNQMTVTITCGPVENSSADVIVLPVNALGEIIGDFDDVRQQHVDQSQSKSSFEKEQILFLPNSSTLDCRTTALAYVPEWTHEEQIDDEEFKKFDQLLKYAKDKDIRSVVIPVDITEGFPFSTFGYKLASGFLSTKGDLKQRLEIFLCIKTLYNGCHLKSKLQRLPFNTDQEDNVTEVLFDIERQLEIRRGKAIQIHVQSDFLISMQSKVDVIVNSVQRNLDLSEGYVSRIVLNTAGYSIQDECKQGYPDGICYGDVAVTGPGQLQCKMLCHGAILRQWIPSGNFSIRVLKSVLRKCLVETDKRHYKTIAMPAVGTGRPGYPYHRVAEAMFDVVTEYQRDHQNTCITDVFFVIHQDDNKIIKAFEFHEERNRSRPKKVQTAVKDDQRVEYVESCVSDLQLRFQIFQLANVLHMVDKPDAVVTFNSNRNTDQVLHKWNVNGNYLDITAYIDGTDDTFKRRVEEILIITEENMITCLAFHLNFGNCFIVTKDPLVLAEYVKEIINDRIYPLGQSTKPVYHYIRQIQFVVCNNTDIKSYMSSRAKGVLKEIGSSPLGWQFVSYTNKSNNMCRVLAEDEAKMNRVQDEVRRLVKQKQNQEQEKNMSEMGISVSLTEEDYNAFCFFAASTSWYKAVEKCVKWVDGSLCIQPITDASKQQVLQLLKEISDMNTLDYPLTKDDELNKASDKCNEVQKEFQGVYLSYDQKDRNIALRSSSYESNFKAKYKLDLSFGRVKVTGRIKRFGDTKGMNVTTRFDKKEADDDISTPGSWNRKDDNQNQAQEKNMSEMGLSVSLTEEDYNAFCFFAASTSWYKAVENCVKWEAGTLCIKPLTDKYKQKVSQLVKEIKDMCTLDYPLTKDDELEKARDKCSEVQKEFQDVYLSCELKDRNISIRSSSYEINLKVKYQLDMSFGEIKVIVRTKRFGNTKNMNVTTKFDKKEADYDISTPGSGSRKEENVQSAGDITMGYKTGGEKLYGCLQEVCHRRGVYRTKEGILVMVYSGSITNSPVDCIVNAANEQLAHGGGVAYAISRAAGYDFDRESREYIQRYGQLRVAECCSTAAGKLPYKCVIHTVGPRWYDYRDKAKCLSDLQHSVEVTFKEAERMQLSSIAVPPISSGIFGVPKTDCVEQYYRAIVSYSHRHGQTSTLKEIHIIDIDTNMIELIQRTFTQMLNSYDQTTAKSQVPNAQGNMDTSVTFRKRGNFPTEHDDHNSERSKQVDDRRANPDIEDCCICMDTPTDPKTLPKCGHTFCTDCIDQYFKVKPVCPICGQVYGKVTGDQPDGHMYMSRSYTSLPGYESCGSIRVTYRFPDGTQGPDHPSPGQRYKGFERSGHLPDNEKGRLAAKLLNVAFKRRLVFTIGISRITGQDGVLTWNDIHHKTRIQGGPGAFGYPDATYLDRVLDELAVKGVTPESADDPEEYREYTGCFRYKY